MSYETIARMLTVNDESVEKPEKKSLFDCFKSKVKVTEDPQMKMVKSRSVGDPETEKPFAEMDMVKTRSTGT